jgi:hypothetical protein
MAHGELLKGIGSVDLSITVEGPFFEETIQYRIAVGNQPPSTIKETMGCLHLS